MWQAWTMTLIGMWIALAPFVPLDLSTVKFNNMIMGAIAALASYLLPKRKFWERWVGMIFGVWIFIAACFPDLTTGSSYLWNNYGSGMMIAIAGLLSVRKSSAGLTRLLDAPRRWLADRRSSSKENVTSKEQTYE